MALITWDNSLSVKVAEIDAQHKKLVDLINDLSAAMKSGKGSDVLDNILTALMDYTVRHFKHEEKYFDKFKYPAAATHKRDHEKFAARVADFKKEFDSGKILLTIEVLDFLKDWLIKHIKGADQRYSKLFNDQGLT